MGYLAARIRGPMGRTRTEGRMPRLSTPLSLIAAATALFMAGLAQAADAQEAPPTAMIIVDGSGSMWGNLGAEKTSKLEMVRDALRALLPSLRSDARVGIASFGHRRRGNCGDVEVILPPDANPSERLATPVEKLNAVGKGPLVLALRETANSLAGGPGSVILIADDIDNCGQDVCTALGGIMASSPKLVVHTVALGFDKAKIAHMSCIARMTGGKLWDAQDAAGFNSALTQAVNLARLQNTPAPQEAPVAKVEEQEKPAKGAPPGLYLSAGLGASSATLDTPVHWVISKPDGEVLRDTRAAALFEKLRPGTYEIVAELGLARVKRTIEVAGDEATQVRVDLNGGVLKMQARTASSGPLLTSAVYTVTPASSGKDATPIWVGQDSQPEIILPAGEYLVRVQNGNARQESKVSIAPATGTTFNSVLAAGTLTLSAARGTAAAPGDAYSDDVTFILYQDDPDAPQGRREVARSAALTPTFVLPAGTYYITARTPTSEVRELIALGAGDTVQRTLALSMAHIKLAATLGGQALTAAEPITFRVVRMGAEPHEVLRTTEKSPELDLSAGRYRLEASLGDSNVIAATEINLAAGQAQKITLPLEAGRVTLKHPEAAGLASNVFWEVRDAKQRIVLRSSQSAPTALLSPGKYLVSAQTNSTPLSNTIEVKANEHRTFDLSP